MPPARTPGIPRPSPGSARPATAGSRARSMAMISATISPTGRNASVKIMPKAITSPDIAARPGRPRRGTVAASLRPRRPGGQGPGRCREQGIGRVGVRLEQVRGRRQRPERRRGPGRRRRQRGPRQQVQRHDRPGAGEQGQQRRRVQGWPAPTGGSAAVHRARAVGTRPGPTAAWRRSRSRPAPGFRSIVRSRMHWTTIRPGGCVPMCSESWLANPVGILGRGTSRDRCTA